MPTVMQRKLPARTERHGTEMGLWQESRLLRQGDGALLKGARKFGGVGSSVGREMESFAG